MTIAVRISFHKYQPLSERQLSVTQLWNVPVGFFSPHTPQVQWLFDFYAFGVQEVSQTLISNLTPSDSHFTSVPPEWSNLCHIQHYHKKKPLRQSVKSRSCLTCKFHTSCLIRFSCYLQSVRDGIFGEGLFFLRLNNTWNNEHSSLFITHACKHTHSFFCFIVPADEAIAASCHGTGCWCGGFSGRIWKQFYWWWLW